MQEQWKDSSGDQSLMTANFSAAIPEDLELPGVDRGSTRSAVFEKQDGGATVLKIRGMKNIVLGPVTSVHEGEDGRLIAVVIVDGVERAIPTTLNYKKRDETID